MPVTGFISRTSGAFEDISHLVLFACEAERRLAPTCRPVLLHAALLPVFGPPDHGRPIAFACRELLRNCFSHAYAPHECVRVGVHLWGTESAGGLMTHLVVADAGCGFDGSIAAGSGLARARAAITAAGGALRHDAGAGTVWRATLPFPPGATLGPWAEASSSLEYLHVTDQQLRA